MPPRIGPGASIRACSMTASRATSPRGGICIACATRALPLSCASSASVSSIWKTPRKTCSCSCFAICRAFVARAELSTWLYRICISQARSVRRRKRVTQTLARLLSLGTAPTLVSTPSLPDAVVRRRVEAALSKMTEGDRTVFVLYEMEGVPGKRIAEIVDSPEASVWRRLHGARQVFRRALEAEDEFS